MTRLRCASFGRSAAYNEEAKIERVVREVDAWLVRSGLDYEILVVDDGSRDRTGEILKSLQGEFPRLKPQNHTVNQGYGAALRTGFDAAVKTYVFYMDGDGQFHIDDLEKLLPLASEDAIVTGYRIERRTRSSPPERTSSSAEVGEHPVNNGARSQLRPSRLMPQEGAARSRSNRPAR